MRTLTCETGTEIRGDVLLALLENMRAEDIERYIQKYNLVDVQEGRWYSIQSFLDLLNELSQYSNQTPNFVAIGIAIAQTAYMPPEMNEATFEDILTHWDEHYQSNHRNGNIGYKAAEKIGRNQYQVTIHGGLYPDDMEYGVLYGFARRFLPPGVPFMIRYAEDVRHMDQGGDETVYIIEWE